MAENRVLEETYDVAVVGAGHAGYEAALASARLGLRWERTLIRLSSSPRC